MFEGIINLFKKMGKKEENKIENKDTAKERLHLVLMQDRANVSADFLDMMKQEIIDVIKKYIDVDESEIDVKLTNKQNSDGTVGAPALYANIPIKSIRNESRKINSSNKSVVSQSDLKNEKSTQSQKNEKEILNSVENKEKQEKVKDIEEKNNKENEEKVKIENKLNSESKKENVKINYNKNIKRNIKNSNNGNNKKANKK